MTICSFVGNESLKNIFHLSAEEAVKHPDYNKYIRVLSKAIKDEEISLATVTLRRKIIQDLKEVF